MVTIAFWPCVVRLSAPLPWVKQAVQHLLGEYVSVPEGNDQCGVVLWFMQLVLFMFPLILWRRC